MSDPNKYPTPPIKYVSNDRGTWAICEVCGTGLRGWFDRAKTQENAIHHLFENHPNWQESNE